MSNFLKLHHKSIIIEFGKHEQERPSFIGTIQFSTVLGTMILGKTQN